MKYHNNNRRYRNKPHVRIYVQIAAIILIALIVSCFVVFLVIKHSVDQLAEEYKEKLIESTADMICSSHQYISGLMMSIQAKEGTPENASEFFQQVDNSSKENSLTPSQQLANDLLESMVNKGVLGLDLMYWVCPPETGIFSDPTVVVSSDNKYIYNPIPDEVAEIVSSSNDYKLFEQGIPEMGLEGEYLVTTFKLDIGNPSVAIWFIDFKPMDEMISSLNTFFDNETRNIYFRILVLGGIVFLLLIIVAFVIMVYLINREIVHPVNELIAAASRVIDGDLDTRVITRRNEEFSSLKVAFNVMVSSLFSILAKAPGGIPYDNQYTQDISQEEPCEKSTSTRRRSILLIQITALFSVAVILTGIFGTLNVASTMDNFVDNTTEKLVEIDAELISSSQPFILSLITEIHANYSYQQFIDIFQNLLNQDKETSDTLSEIGTFPQMINNGLFGFTLVYDIFPATPGITDSDLVIISSNDEYLFSRPAENIMDFIDETSKDGPSWKFFKNGIPEMGIDEACLVNVYPYEVPNLPNPIWAVSFKPIGDEIESFTDFSNSETQKFVVLFGVSAVMSILFVVVVIFFFLNYLLKKKISGPIDEIQAAVEKIMDGNLEVIINVHPGEEFEDLKAQFNEMFKALSDLLAGSSDE